MTTIKTPVVYVVSLFPCWSETFIVREIYALLRRGIDVRILSLKQPSEAMVHPSAEALLNRVHWAGGFNHAWKAAVEVLLHPWSSISALAVAVGSLWRHPQALAKTIVSFWRAMGCMGWLRNTGSRHIHAHWATYPSSAAWLMARAGGLGFSFTSHAHDLFLEDHFFARKVLDSRFSVTISRFNENLILSRHGRRVSERVHVIHCGVDLSEFDSGARAGDSSRMLSVGRLDPIKGFDVLIDACALLRGQGHEFLCEIIGEGAQRSVLEAMIARSELQDVVKLLGAKPQAEVRENMFNAGIFVMPSVRTPEGNMDGIPVALMEAMAMRKAVISTRVSGIPELIEDGASGLLVSPRDAAELAAAMSRLLRDSQLRSRIGEAARRRVAAEFDAEHEGGRVLDLIIETSG